jgi:hypothetical protein
MNVRLSPEDAAAVDLLLDRAATARVNGGDANDGMTFASAAAAGHASVSNERIAAAERVLHVLDAMPKNEPSDNLLQRTLARVESGAAAAAMRGASPLIDMTRPVM